MLDRLHRIYRNFYSWKRNVWNCEEEFQVPFYKKVKYALKGFSTNEYVWYDFEHTDFHQYISEYERLKSREINGPYKFILDDKMIFEEIFRQYVRVPINYAWIENGNFYGLHSYVLNNDNLIYFLRQIKKSVLKYLDRGGGSGTYVIDASGDEMLLNGKYASEETIWRIFGREGKSVLCEYITQSDFAASLYQETTNTIRIICAKEKNEMNAHIISAVHRIGRRASIPVDNFSSGGLVSEINLETGELSEAIAGHGEEKNRMVFYEVHPDTGQPIKGKKVPGWNKLLRDIEALTNQIPYLNFVAWDVLLSKTEEGTEGYCIIEGNASSSCDLLQMRHGIRNDRMGEIYRSYGIIN